MKFLTFQKKDKESIGVLKEGRVWDLLKMGELYHPDQPYPVDLSALICKYDSFRPIIGEDLVRGKAEGKEEVLTWSVEEITIIAPIPKPRKNIMCVGKNYRDHAIEMGSENDIPTDLLVFTKSPTSVIGPFHSVNLHEDVTSEVDYEGELAVVIGQEGKNIPLENALDFVFGYSILNDITARDLQRKHKQFFIGKSLDTFCPLGPVIVTKDEIKHPDNLSIMTTVNDEVRQSSNTEQLIFSISEVIATLSKGMTLQPGDIIAMGTPAGVGKGMKPPVFLKSGDSVTISIEGIGKLTNLMQ
ncbi:fumarylacetoacetate hydrolase family protein [Bacillus sp. 2205SS5-2]|uniref:fumarylacetoacetate hydrolase family protein n=1 Tax=Bacillus sp. 2205SS5-2 TaxID=3109031 RepID=UPI003004C577